MDEQAHGQGITMGGWRVESHVRVIESHVGQVESHVLSLESHAAHIRILPLSG